MDRELMSNFQCNSCQGTYADTLANGTPYFHVCSAEIIEHAEYDNRGHLVKPEKRTPRPDVRDERPAPNLVYIDGKPFVYVPIPGENGLFTLAPATTLIVSEGKGRTQIG